MTSTSTSSVAISLSPCRCLLPHMLERSSGLVCVVSCVEAALSAPFLSTLAATKQVPSQCSRSQYPLPPAQALAGYFTSLRHEVAGCGLGVTLVVAGPVSPHQPEQQQQLARIELCNLSSIDTQSKNELSSW